MRIFKDKSFIYVFSLEIKTDDLLGRVRLQVTPVRYSDRFFKHETNGHCSQKTIVSENGRLEKFIHLKMVSIIVEPNFLIGQVELLMI